MKYITDFNLEKYKDDIFECYENNPLIFDCQTPLHVKSTDELLYFVKGFAISKDSIIYGIVDDKEDFLYGLVIFDNMRFGNNGSCAQVHLSLSKIIWGKIGRICCQEILNDCVFTTVYCEIPKKAVPAIKLAKTLGFKKTGYVPNCIPYKDKNGEDTLYDLYTYVWTRNNE